MSKRIYVIICLAIMLLLGACGKKGKESEVISIANGGNLVNDDAADLADGQTFEEGKEIEISEVGNGGDQIDIDSKEAPGGDENDAESDVKIGEESSDTVTIVVDWDKIIVDGSECSDVEEMKDEIIRSGCKKIELQHNDANKVTLDEVQNILKEIEETLEIDVNYN